MDLYINKLDNTNSILSVNILTIFRPSSLNDVNACFIALRLCGLLFLKRGSESTFTSIVSELKDFVFKGVALSMYVLRNIFNDVDSVKNL